MLSLSLNNMEELLMVERGSFHNLPEVVKLELCINPLLSYVDPQAFRLVAPPIALELCQTSAPGPGGCTLPILTPDGYVVFAMFFT